MLARVWQLAEDPAVSIVKGATDAGQANQSTDKLLFIRLADITETEIIQHHQGTFFLPPLVVPMIPPSPGEGAG